MVRLSRLERLFDAMDMGESYYHQGAYYRLKDYGDGVYALQRAVAGMCGEKTASPSLKFYFKNGKLVYQFYVDFEAQPLVMKPYTPDEADFFGEAMDHLLDHFEALFDGQAPQEYR